tara:strand:+ start:801 stop:1139 length:339 start_codon:yes stop_codon:yes gene_type:complete
MEALAKTRHIRQSAKKMRFGIQMVKGMSAENAIRKLEFTNKKSAQCINKTIKAAVANLMNKDGQIDSSSIVIKSIYADEGPTMKRFRPAAMGRAVPILKRTSHLTVVVENKE